MDEEVEMAFHRTSKKKKGKDGVGLNKTLPQERTPYHIVQRKGKTKAIVSLPIKKLLMAPKKNKERKKFMNQARSCRCMWICIRPRSLTMKVIICWFC